MQNKILKLGLFAVSHLFIDLVGIYILFYKYNHLTISNIAIYFIIYNLLAFGMQVVFGYYADKYKLYKMFILLSLLLASMALLVYEVGIFPILIMTVANALVHVGGGVLSVDMFKGKSMPAGVFVAPGAFGVFIGFMLALSETSVAIYLSPIAILLFVINYFVLQSHTHEQEYGPINKHTYKLIFLILIIIAIRSFLGSIFILEWNDSNTMYLLLVIAIFLGKFMGGILGDRFGFKQIGSYGLIISTPFLMLGRYYMVFGLVGAFLFNLTMAITLFLIMDLLKPYKGFAFGLTTLTLVLFFIPSQLGLVINTDVIYYSIVVIGTLGAAHVLNETIMIYERGR